MKPLPKIIGPTVHPKHGREWKSISMLKDGEIERAAAEAFAISNHPRPLPRLVLAHALYEAGEIERAYDVLRDAIATCKPDASLFEALGCVAEALERRGEAAASFRAALRLDPARAAAFSSLARMLLADGRTGEFLEQARRAITWMPDAFEQDRELYRRYLELVSTHDFDDTILAREPLPCSRPRPDSRRILFVSERPIAREWKLASALAAQGMRIDLAVPESRPLPYRDAGVFDCVFTFEDAEQLQTIHECGSYRLAHFFVYKDYRTLARILQRKSCPMVVDIYDPLSGMFSDEQTGVLGLDGQARLERYCLESVDGVVCRDLRLQHVKRNFPLVISAPQLFFPDYVSSASATPATRRSAETGETHVVHGGGIGRRAASQHEAAVHWLGKLASRHGVHLHIYAHNFATRGILDEYAEIARTNDRIHVHESVPPEDWIRELATYDAQLLIPRSCAEAWSHLGWSTANLALCSCNRIFDSVAAGVPIVGGREYGAMRWAERRGFGVTARRRDMESATFWRSLLKPALHDPQRYARLRRSLSIARHAPRLARFYDRVVERAVRPSGRRIVSQPSERPACRPVNAETL